MVAPAKRWSLSEEDLRDITPRKVRDLIIHCFYEAQRETFARARRKAGSIDTGADSLRAAVVASVRTAFKEVSGSFDAPTVESLEDVVGVLGRRAAGWGTPPDVVEHHGRQVATLLERLRSARAP